MPTITPVTDTDYTALTSDQTISYTTLTAARIVTLPASGLTAGQEITLRDATGLAHWHPLIALGMINGGSWAAVTDSFGEIKLRWSGSQWTTPSRPNAAPAPTITGTTYYVSPSGVDTAAGTSPATAWKTVAKVNTFIATSSFHAGDAILFQGGQTFSDAALILAQQVGTPAAPVVFGSYGTGQAKLTQTLTLRCSWAIVDNLFLNCTATGGTQIQGGSPSANIRGNDVVVQRCLLRGNQTTNLSPGIYVWGVNWTIQDNAIIEIGNTGVYCDDAPGSTRPSDNVAVQRNLIMRIPEGPSGAHNHGVYPRATNITVLANVMCGVGASGVCPRYRNSIIRHNHIAETTEGLAWFQYDPKPGRSEWTGNRIYASTDAGIYISSGDTSDVGVFIATQESFTITGNTIGPLSGAVINPNATAGVYEIYGNECLAPGLPNQVQIGSDSSSDPLVPAPQSGWVFADADYQMRKIDSGVVARAGVTITLPPDANPNGRYSVKNLASIGNLYPNPSYETTVADMAASHCTLAQTTAQAFSGTHSLQITASGTPSTVAYLGAGFPVIAGVTYTASAYARAAATPRHWYIEMDWYSSSGFLASAEGAAVLETISGWTRMRLTATAPAGAIGLNVLHVSDDSLAASEVHYLDAMMLAAAAALQPYGDGDTAGWAWTGTAGHSSSTGPDPTVTVATPGGVIDLGGTAPSSTSTISRNAVARFALAPDGLNWIAI